MQLRLFTPDDYPATVDLFNVCYPTWPITVDEARHRDDHPGEHCLWQRWVAEREDEVVAWAHYRQHPSAYHPQKFILELYVHPEQRGQGIGSALYNQLLAVLGPHNPLRLEGFVQEDQEAGVRFLHQRGFTEERRSWESRLHLPTFDLTPYAGVETPLLEQGITLHPLAELEGTPGWERRLYELECQLMGDVPRTGDYTPLSFDYFLENRFHNPNLLREAWILARHGEEYVGSTNLWRSAPSDSLTTGLTGVRRDYRRKGIALGLKVRAIAWAIEAGYTTIRTMNASTNRPMLAINERMGFVKQPVWIDFAKGDVSSQ